MTTPWIEWGVKNYQLFDQVRREHLERTEYFMCIALPIYGMRYSIKYDRDRWSQTHLYIGLNRGFRYFHVPIDEAVL